MMDAQGIPIPSQIMECIQAARSFDVVSNLLLLYAILPVTSCEAERSFSQLRLVKTRLRSTMLDERLNSLMLMKIHRDITTNLPLNTIIDRFASCNRKMALKC